MPFSSGVKKKLLLKAGRRCCVCMTFCGSRIEVHHIIPEADGGPSTEDNGIPLCFNCHMDVGAYNDKHPKGTKFSADELRLHRERMFDWIKDNGALVADVVARETFVASHHALVREETASHLKPVSLSQEAKVARYLRYISEADRARECLAWPEAIASYTAAFNIAESDDTLAPYVQGGNYHGRKLALWLCLLECAAQYGNRDCLRSALNLGFDENTIREALLADGVPGGLACREYFYLLLQDKLLLFDHQMPSRLSANERLERLGNLMDIIQNPHCPQKQETLINRAREFQNQLKNALPR